MMGLENLIEFQKFLARNSLEPVFTITLEERAWFSLLKEAKAVAEHIHWMGRTPMVEVLGITQVIRIVGPHGYIHVRCP